MGKRFLPVYFLKMAQRLKQGTPRRQIIAELSEKHGIPRGTVGVYLRRVFPKEKATTPAAITALLWEKKRTILSSSDRKKIALKREAGLTAEQRRERSLKAAVRLKKLFEGVEYIAGLPALNLLNEVERNNLFQRHVGIVDEAVERFKGRLDFDEIRGVADLLSLLL